MTGVIAAQQVAGVVDWRLFWLNMASFLLGVGVTLALAYPAWKYLKDELRLTQDRLYGAWKDGMAIPPRADEEPIEIPPLPPELRALVDEWESPTVKAQVEDRIRRLQARGLDTPAIAKVMFLEQEKTRFDT